MRIDPITDLVTFLTMPVFGEPPWLHYVYWLLAIVSLSIASAAWRALPGQARPIHLWRFAVRLLVASFWWQQLLLAFPTDTSTLRYWTDRQVQQSAYKLQALFIKFLILPVFTPFAHVVFALDVVMVATLFLGIGVRLGAAIGAMLTAFVFLGLYKAPQEWPWSYVFILVLMLTIVVDDYGGSLGLDAYRAARSLAAKRRRAAATAD